MARRLATASPRELAGVFAQAVNEATGADALFFLDFRSLLKMTSPAMGMNASTLPLWLSYRGGAAANFELRVPLELLKGLASFAPMLMGLDLGQQP